MPMMISGARSYPMERVILEIGYVWHEKNPYGQLRNPFVERCLPRQKQKPTARQTHCSIHGNEGHEPEFHLDFLVIGISKLH